eukprot:Nk52_evm16s222 gene=Nk52_evmTU16s222
MEEGPGAEVSLGGGSASAMSSNSAIELEEENHNAEGEPTEGVYGNSPERILSSKKPAVTLGQKVKSLPPPEYLERIVFPYLMPALEELLEVAKRCSQERIGVSERLLVAFDPLIWLSQYLFNNNPYQCERDPHEHPFAEEIKEVKKFSENLQNPRTYPPQVLEPPEKIIRAACALQAFGRGFILRRKSLIETLKGISERSSSMRPIALIVFVQKIWRGAVVRKKKRENRLLPPPLSAESEFKLMEGGGAAFKESFSGSNGEEESISDIQVQRMEENGIKISEHDAEETVVEEDGEASGPVPGENSGTEGGGVEVNKEADPNTTTTQEEPADAAPGENQSNES